MTTTEITRILDAELLDLSRVKGSGDRAYREIVARAVRYDEPNVVTDGGPPYTEAWAPSVFKRSLHNLQRAGKALPIYWEHDRRRHVGSVVEWANSDTALDFRGRIPLASELSRQAVALIEDGSLTGISVGARGMPNGFVRRNGVIVRTEAALREVSLTPDPALMGAEVLELRSKSPLLADDDDDELVEDPPEPTPAEPVPTPNLDAARELLDSLTLD